MSEATEWRSDSLIGGDGVLVGTDHDLESWLPWWYANLCKHNDLPVTVIDFGMSLPMKQWCQQRWEVIPLDLPVSLFKNRMPLIEEKVGRKKMRFMKRWCWFRKPFAFLKSPYTRTLWLDIDCLVLEGLNELFRYADNPYGVAMGVDLRQEKIQRKINAGILKPGEHNFNSGVIPYQHGAPLIQQWAQAVIDFEDYFLSDQDIFSRLVGDLHADIPIIPQKYNWLVPELGISKEAIVLHFMEDSKVLAQQLIDDFNKRKVK